MINMQGKRAKSDEIRLSHAAVEKGREATPIRKDGASYPTDETVVKDMGVKLK